MKLRVSLTQRRDEIAGTVELPSDPAFVLEALQMVIERFSKQCGVPPDAVVRDLYSLVTNKVT